MGKEEGNGYLLKNNVWVTSIIEGKIEEKPGRGRPKHSLMWSRSCQT